MKKCQLFLLLLTCSLFGCAHYKIPTSTFPRQNESSQHWLYTVVPRHRTQIQWYDFGHWCTWAILGNDDDGIFGEAKKSNYGYNKPIGVLRAIKWTARNPFHNFCFYVIGDAYRQNDEYVIAKFSPEGTEAFRHYEKAKTVFCSKNSSFFFCFHGCKPFISFRVRINKEKTCEFYLGWRERGNFGVKFAPYTNAKKDSSPEK